MDAVGVALARPVPVADAEVVRQVARRASALAGELGRVRAVTGGLLGSVAGWSGAAALAFQESSTRELSRFTPVLDRLEKYAAALAGYAGELDRVQPRLRAARSRLQAEPQDGPVLAEFEACWSEWATARDRCVARLQAAAGTVHSRHWWSGLSDVVSAVEHGVRLADCSRLLAEVGQGLVAAGLVCALVCPPLAGAVWAAVAVVAVCQLVVDAARRERGESVGWAGLGWDMAAVVPAGRIVRQVHVAVAEVGEVHTAAEASAAIRRLPKRLRSSPLVPGGGLERHEGTATHRGHTILKHVKKTRAELMRRFQTEPNLMLSSSFTDRGTAEAAIARALKQNERAIQTWLTMPQPLLRLRADVGVDIGHSVAKNGTMVHTSELRVILGKENSVLGYYIKTAYPMP
jgi:hypothetical protein